MRSLDSFLTVSVSVFFLYTAQVVRGICNDTDLRLVQPIQRDRDYISQVGGDPEFFGRVEVCFNDTWGSICSTHWSHEDAIVACRQLGYPEYPNGAYAFTGFRHSNGSGLGPLFMNNLRCTGHESKLTDCPRGLLHSGICSDERRVEAGVRCVPSYIPCSNGETVRIRGGNDTSGVVEICHNDTWGTVCDNLWDDADALVVCRELGFSENSPKALTTSFSDYSGPGFSLNYVECVGNETFLTDCLSSPMNMYIRFCDQNDYAGVSCNRVCEDGTVRLQNGTSDMEGRVEFCFNDTWGTVCDNTWTSVEAAIVCIQLGLPSTNATVLLGSQVVSGTTEPIWLNNITCYGIETELGRCPNNGFGGHDNCSHAQDVGVICAGTTCAEGDVRLVGENTNSTTGRIEVCLSNAWGTVCDWHFDDVDAQVACRQLGLPHTTATIVSRQFTEDGIGPVWLSLLDCQSTQGRLVDCRNDGNLRPFSQCSHMYDVGVNCTGVSCEDGDIRLEDGVFHGRVEVCFNNDWRPVCDTLWDDTDARVACRQLGFPYTAALAVTSGYRTESTFFLLRDVECTGNESRLIDCPMNLNQAQNGCLYTGNSAGVSCAATSCEEGAGRIAGGSDVQGRVEICHDNVWGSVCQYSWGWYENNNARVLCKELGLPSTFARAVTTGVPRGTGEFWLFAYYCDGTERRIADCLSRTLPRGVYRCGHSTEVGAMCAGTTCPQGAVRLQGDDENSGRVEICNDDWWGTVCGEDWDDDDARVVCRQLGLPSRGSFATLEGFPHGFTYFELGNINCTGNETSLFDCQRTGLTRAICSGPQVGVSCVHFTCANGDVRLQGGTSTFGRLEVCVDNAWGTVCSDTDNVMTARVACRQLGLPTEAALLLDSGFPSGTTSQPIWLRNLQCTGSESSLINCPSSLTAAFCGHDQDVGVVCAATGCTEGALRLQGGNITRGYVEICHSNLWGPVCDWSWSDDEARVACLQLGLPSSTATAIQPGFAGGSEESPTWIASYIRCRGIETRLADCPHSGFSGLTRCSPSSDIVGVCCTGVACMEGDIRLQGGAGSRNEGRVEICHRETWGTVCDDFWGDVNAKVVCRQLGLPNAQAVSIALPLTLSRSGPIWLDNVKCRGDEERLIDCRARPFGVHNCNQFDDAGVKCRELCTSGTVRLRGESIGEGILEVCYQNVWGTVCGDGWTGSNTVVACRHLGFSTRGASSYTPDEAELSPDPVWLHGVQCRGTETSLIVGSSGCTHIFGSNSCAVGDSIGITCDPAGCAGEGIDVSQVISYSAIRQQENSINITIRDPANLSLSQHGYFELNLYLSDDPNQSLNLPIHTTQSSGSSFVTTAPDICQSYWATISAISCGTTGRSKASFIDVFEPRSFRATLHLELDGPCSEWIRNDQEQLEAEAKTVIEETLSDECGFSVCVVNSTLSCRADDVDLVNMTVTLVNSNSVSGEEQVQCLADWARGVAGNGQLIFLDTTPVIITNSGPSSGPDDGSSSLLATVAGTLSAAGAILALSIIFMFFAIRFYKRRSAGITPRQWWNSASRSSRENLYSDQQRNSPDSTSSLMEMIEVKGIDKPDD